MEPDYVEKIHGAFEEHPNCQILAFALHHPTKRFPAREHRIGYFRSWQIGSYQIAFRKCKLVTSTPFCEKMGSGSGNGGGEENKFLVDCLRKGARIRLLARPRLDRPHDLRNRRRLCLPVLYYPLARPLRRARKHVAKQGAMATQWLLRKALINLTIS